MTDEQLIQSYLAGNAAAFAELYGRYRRPVYGYLNGMLPGQGATIDDLFQQTWIKVIDHLPNYKDDGRFIGYVLRIARSRAIDYLRKHKREVVLPPDMMELDGVSGPPSADWENREIAEAIDAAVATLPEDQREVFLMRRQEIPFKDIAVAQNVGINTVLGRMRYAMENLRATLVQAGVQV